MTVQTPLISFGLWFDSNAEEAVDFYTAVFPDLAVVRKLHYTEAGKEIHQRPPGSVMVIDFDLFGMRFEALNGGPVFRINPSISFMILCDTAAEAETFWKALSAGGKVLMDLDTYPWSERYGWLEDKYGVSWQIYTGEPNGAGQKISPSLMFAGKQHGRAEEAIRFYTALFKNTMIEGILKYPAGGMDPEGTVQHAQFRLDNQVFMAMDSAGNHEFQFNEGVSFVVTCYNQQEIDYYWDAFTAAGEESECGWLKDKFGVSWQIVPAQLSEMLLDSDTEKVTRVTNALMQMRKIDLQKLEAAFAGQ